MVEGVKGARIMRLITMAVLGEISQEMNRIFWNLFQQEDFNSPFINSGGKFKCDTFEVEAYSWTDENQEYNFKWKDVKISWYKHYRRGLEIPPDLTLEKLNEMLEDCIRALIEIEDKEIRDVSVWNYEDVSNPNARWEDDS